MAIVTVYTDASWCPDTLAGGWGAWIRRDEARHLAGGAFRRPITDGNAAELAAAANGIAAAIRLGLARTGDLVVDVSDSAAVGQHLLGGPEASGHSLFGPMIGATAAMLERHGVRAKVNWVKGHSRRDGSRSHVNRLVDREAGRHMRSARERARSARATPDTGVEDARGLGP